MTDTPRTEEQLVLALLTKKQETIDQLERENAEMLGVLESILPYIEGDTKVPWKPALAVITKAKGKP